MTQEQQLLRNIKNNHQLIERKKTMIKDHLSKLINLVSIQDLSMSLFKETMTLRDFHDAVGESTGLSVGEVKLMCKDYSYIGKTKLLDKSTLEKLTLLPKANRKSPARRSGNRRNSLMVVGDLVSNCRKMREQSAIGSADKAIICTMLSDLMKEFKV